MENIKPFKIGYARVSTYDQNLDLQMDALKKAGCDKIFKDKTSGAKTERIGLNNALEHLRQGDVLVVWKLDRLGRSLKHLLEIINSLHDKGIGFLSLNENIDTTSSTGKLIFHIFASLSEFERDIIRERTKAGLKSARARGRLGGRPKKMDKEKMIIAKALMKDNTIPVKEICKKLGIGKTTLYKYLKKENF